MFVDVGVSFSVVVLDSVMAFVVVVVVVLVAVQ